MWLWILVGLGLLAGAGFAATRANHYQPKNDDEATADYLTWGHEP
jgi:hypothetical protein